MNINLLHPLKAVQSGIDRPDIPLAFFLVLLPSIVSAAIMVWWGFSVNWMIIGFGVLKSIANWVLLGIVLYVISYLVAGKAVSGKFSGILSSASLLWLVGLLATLVGVAFVASFGPQLISLLSVIGPDSSPQVISDIGVSVSSLIDSESGQLFSGIRLGLFAVGLLLVVLGAGILFFLVSDLLPKSRWLTRLLAWGIVLVSWMLLSSVIMTI